MTDPVQPTEEAIDAAVDAFGPLFGVGGDVRWHRGTAKEVVDAVLPLLRREVAAEIRSDETVEVVARFLWPDWVDDAAAKKLAKAKNIADAVATRIEGPT